MESNFLTRHIKGRVYSIIEVPENAREFVLDNAMQYLTFKIPNYKNWVSDKVLKDPGKLVRWIERHNGKGRSDWILSGAKLPEGKYKLVGLAKDISEKDGKKIHLSKIITGHPPKITLIIEKI